jgi:hypothetical protein
MRPETRNLRPGRVIAGTLLAVCLASGGQFTGPANWALVNTNAVKQWNADQQKRASAQVAVWPGVVADKQKREVRLLAEAVGHAAGITTEFLLIGPLSDRAYESAAVTVSKPSDIVRAMASLGVAAGGCVGSRPFRFWPCGERVSATVRRLDVAGAAEEPLSSLIRDSEPAVPLVGDGGLVFTGGRWLGDSAAQGCWSDTNMPSSVISLYNEPSTTFDVPFQVGQSEVYGRLTLAQALPYGALLEIVFRPQLSKDGQPRVMPLTAKASMQGQDVSVACSGADGAVLKRAGLADTLTWLRSLSEQGRELFVTLDMDDAMPLKRAVDVARVFVMLDGKGIKLDGKTVPGLFPRAFLPQEKWRERKDRTPQPFELHVTRDASGKILKKLVFIEEDWTVEGLDPKLTPKEYPFEKWEDFPGLVAKTGGPDSKVTLLFVFAPAELPLEAFMPGVRAVAERLPLVYVFCD